MSLSSLVNVTAWRLSGLNLSGNKRSGKDTMAREFANAGYAHHSFAEYLKEIAEKMILLLFPDLKIDYFDWDSGEFKESRINSVLNENNITYREFLEEFGTNFVKKKINLHYWICILREKIANEISDKIVVSDTRFIEERTELENYRNWNVVSVGIERTNNINTGSVAETQIPALVDSADYKIKNHGALCDYRSKCRELVKIIEKRFDNKI